MKFKKILFTLLFVFVALFMLGVSKVNAATEYEEKLIYKIAPDGKNATLKMVNPTDEGEFYIILENVLNQLLNEDDYKATAYATNDELTSCVIKIYNSNNYEEIGTYNINVTYEEPKENEVVNSILRKLKKPNDVYDFENFYYVSDLNLINLYMVGDLWQKNEANHLKFSNDFIEISEGSDVSFYLITRAGSGGHMFSCAAGDMSLFYDGYCYANFMTGIYLQNVIYIPENTKETPEEYVKAAQKRINDYLGKNSEVKVAYGGTLNSLENYDNGDDVLQKEKNDGNYYNVTIEGETYKFYIMKGSENKLKKPKYKGKHIKSDIKITTDDSTVPLDTHLVVEKVKNDEIKNAIGTDNYDAYDIKLYSTAQNASIQKLVNGKFLVSVPVSKELNGKNIAIYYLNSNSELEEYEAVVNDEIVSFETNHFSTYILAEKKENDVKTYKLILDANGGEFSTGENTLEFEDITKCTSDDIKEPVRNGYIFKGFYTEDGISFETLMNSEAGIEEDTTFYAKWEEASIEGEQPIPQPDNTEVGNNPPTGDNIVFFLGMMFIAVIGIEVTSKFKKYYKTK